MVWKNNYSFLYEPLSSETQLINLCPIGVFKKFSCENVCMQMSKIEYKRGRLLN